MLFRQLWMNFHTRFRILLHEWTDPSRWCTRKNLADDPPRGQDHRIFGIHVFRRRPILGDVEPRSAVGKIEGPRAARDRIPRSRLEQSERPAMVFAGTGPEDAELPL